MKDGDAIAFMCLKHWYECDGCPFCQDVRDHYAREDERQAEFVKTIMDALPKKPLPPE